MTTTESKTYQDMLSEVELIVREVGSPQIDLDKMVDKVERGYALIQAMQTRLNNTKARIEELSSKFGSEDSSTSS